MDLEEIEKLIEVMRSNGTKRLVLKQEGFEIELEQQSHGGVYKEVEPHPPISPSVEQPIMSPKEEPENVCRITSPMVGTFYEGPSPDDPPFIKVGDEVDEETIVCIIEAMKVMNEVKGGVKGTVTEILVKNGDPVEFGTILFRVKPA